LQDNIEWHIRLPNYSGKKQEREDSFTVDKEAEEAYNERQNQPLLRPMFTKAKELIPREVVEARTRDYQCYNIKRGCIIPKRERHLPYCAVCYCYMSLGEEFRERKRLLTTDEVFAMNDWQKEKILSS
jgi:hypothetical protein